MHKLSFDKAVYSDSGLETEIDGPFDVSSTTTLPRDVYFSETEYVAEGKNSIGQLLWTVTFTYPDHVDDEGGISTASGAVYT